METELDSDCEENIVERNTRAQESNNFCDYRVFTGEVPPSPGLGAGLEYDLWEGQFQFVGQCSQRERTLRQNHSGALDEQVRTSIHSRLMTAFDFYVTNLFLIYGYV